ncbi:DUF7146 domain-containing protein [Lentilitoribacter sp. EG35]|uniref:DUF7146 domain-containing protein n=1 Tax=Lentilitoribacter sp. EG35 TaxID=3234192 RepID=UPI00345F45E6
MSGAASRKIPDEWIERAKSVSILDLALDYGASLKPGPRQMSALEHCGPCPVCGGKDRFSINTQKNVFNCRGCGLGGGPIRLAVHVHGWDFRVAICDIIGEQDPAAVVKDTKPLRQKPIKPAQQRSSDESNEWRLKKRKLAYSFWKEGQKNHHMANAYFEVRGLSLPDDILYKFRVIENMEYHHLNKSSGRQEVIYTGPALLAPIVGPGGKFIGLHRSWIDLNRQKGKAQIVDPETGELCVSKKVIGSQKGGHIVLRDDGVQNKVALAEGYESILSYDARHDIEDHALWTAVNLGNLCGKSISRIKHPSKTITTRNKHKRAVKVGGPLADLSDMDALILPERFESAIVASDFDGDVFDVKCKRMRAVERHSKLGSKHGRSVLDDPAPFGRDWNDEHLAQLELM